MEPNIITHELISQTVQEDGTLLNEWQSRDEPLVLEDHHVYHDQQWIVVRQQRNRLLAESDWVVARAYEQNQPVPPAWLEYRQALRDVTQQLNPFFITWPTEPDNQAQQTTQYIAVDEEVL